MSGAAKRSIPISWEKKFVPILYQNPAFGTSDDFSDFVESISCETSKTCQVRGSSRRRGAIPLASIDYKEFFVLVYGFCTRSGRL